MLSPVHALLIAAIFVPYMVMMVTLGTYMWLQVRHHLGNGEDPPGSGEDEGPGDVLLAA